MSSAARPWRVAALVVAGVVAADLVTKQLVLAELDAGERVHLVGPVTLVSRRNTGGAFSLAHGRGFFPWFVTGLVIALVVWFVRRLLANDGRLRGVALVAVSAMVGGALGNQVDRWFRHPAWNRGAVVDFISVSFWPGIFNVADAALVCGAIVIALLSLRRTDAGARDGGPTDHQQTTVSE